MMTEKNEQRKNTRVVLKTKAEIIFPDGTRFSGTIKDISFSGVFIFSEELVGKEKKGNCQLILNYLSGSESESISLGSKVVRYSKEGAAIIFSSIDYYDYKVFKLLIFSKALSIKEIKEELAGNPGPTILGIPDRVESKKSNKA